MYLQTLHRDSTIDDATARALQSAKIRGPIKRIVAEVQSHLFSPQEDVFITLEVDSATKQEQV